MFSHYQLHLPAYSDPLNPLITTDIISYIISFHCLHSYRADSQMDGMVLSELGSLYQIFYPLPAPASLYSSFLHYINSPLSRFHTGGSYSRDRRGCIGICETFVASNPLISADLFQILLLTLYESSIFFISHYWLMHMQQARLCQHLLDLKLPCSCCRVSSASMFPQENKCKKL